LNRIEHETEGGGNENEVMEPNNLVLITDFHMEVVVDGEGIFHMHYVRTASHPLDMV